MRVFAIEVVGLAALHSVISYLIMIDDTVDFQPALYWLANTLLINDKKLLCLEYLSSNSELFID